MHDRYRKEAVRYDAAGFLLVQASEHVYGVCVCKLRGWENM